MDGRSNSGISCLEAVHKGSLTVSEDLNKILAKIFLLDNHEEDSRSE
jgi:hypothetical protein